MTPPTEQRQWQVLGASQVGARNMARSKPKQDAMHWLPVSGRSRRPVIAVADGHGSDEHFRSAKGAFFAIQAATEVLREFVQSHMRETDLEQLQHWAQVELPSIIVERWRESIDLDLQKTPFAPAELDTMGVRMMEDLFRDGCAQYLPYGSTLLGLAYTDHYQLAIQLGDGCIGALNLATPTHVLFAPDAALDAASLCNPDAVQLFRASVQPLHPDTPLLVCLSTDGHRNAFDSTEAYLQYIASSLIELRRDGLLRVAERLSRWTTRQSQELTGEDITCAMVYSLDDYHRHHTLRKRNRNQ
jgi:Protein phosphatase 2C